MILPVVVMETKPAATQPTGCEDIMHETGGIPKFDLAEQIMAEQRKIAATKRKGPGRKAEPPRPLRKAQSTASYAALSPILSEQQRIIAEIVSRDIAKLFAGAASDF